MYDDILHRNLVNCGAISDKILIRHIYRPKQPTPQRHRRCSEGRTVLSATRRAAEAAEAAVAATVHPRRQGRTQHFTIAIGTRAVHIHVLICRNTSLGCAIGCACPNPTDYAIRKSC